jgi:hypothetical protein
MTGYGLDIGVVFTRSIPGCMFYFGYGQGWDWVIKPVVLEEHFYDWL